MVKRYKVIDSTKPRIPRNHLKDISTEVMGKESTCRILYHTLTKIDPDIPRQTKVSDRNVSKPLSIQAKTDIDEIMADSPDVLWHARRIKMEFGKHKV